MCDGHVVTKSYRWLSSGYCGFLSHEENSDANIDATSMFYNVFRIVFFVFFSVRLLSVLRGHSFCSSPPQLPMTSDIEGFSIPNFIHYIYFLILILEKEQFFPFLMFSDKQGNYLVPFI